MGVMPLASCADNAGKHKIMEDKKTLVVYFSRAGENYSVGNIKKGNTQIVAEMIAGEVGADTFHIEPARPYPDDYTRCTEVAQQEVDEQARPAVKGDARVEDYDVVFIGYPIWWGDMPMPVYTFIEKHDWRGKTVISFATHEGSGMSGTERKLKSVCKGAVVAAGLAVRGATAQNNRAQTEKMVESWIRSIEY